MVDKVNLAMRGRYVETVVTKKRASSRDFINAYDREESSGILTLIISFFLSIYIYCSVCDLISIQKKRRNRAACAFFYSK